MKKYSFYIFILIFSLFFVLVSCDGMNINNGENNNNTDKPQICEYCGESKEEGEHWVCSYCHEPRCNGENHSVMPCRKHHACEKDGLDHSYCSSCKSYKCDGKQHGICSVCGEALCTGEHDHGDIVVELCEHCGNPVNNGESHSLMDCGHYACLKSDADHSYCEACQSYKCNGKDHSLRTCGVHYNCVEDDLDHEICPNCSKPLCNGETHIHNMIEICEYCGQEILDNTHYQLACGHYNCVHDELNHNKCGECDEYLCNGKDHSQMDCGHYACNAGDADHTLRDCGLHYNCLEDELNHGECVVCHEPLCNGASHIHVIYYVCSHCGEKYTSGGHEQFACGHWECDHDGLDHSRCKECGKYLCNGDDHTARACGHYSCVKDDLNHNACDHCDGYFCDGASHIQMDCGHYVCDQGDLDHSKCPQCHEYLCNGENHTKLACGHYACIEDELTHTICSHCGNYLCNGGNHSKADCGHYNCVSDDLDHTICSHCGYYLCNGEDHTTLWGCGHYECERLHDGLNHNLRECMIHYYCHSDDLDHSICEVCEEPLCNGEDHNHSITRCEHCGQNINVGDHSQMDCGHYACAPGDFESHEYCWECYDYKCNGEDHSQMDCGHYACNPGWYDSHELCIHCGGYLCNGDYHAVRECGLHYYCVSDDLDHYNCSVCGLPLCTGDHDHGGGGEELDFCKYCGELDVHHELCPWCCKPTCPTLGYDHSNCPPQPEENVELSGTFTRHFIFDYLEYFYNPDPILGYSQGYIHAEAEYDAILILNGDGTGKFKVMAPNMMLLVDYTQPQQIEAANCDITYTLDANGFVDIAFTSMTIIKQTVVLDLFNGNHQVTVETIILDPSVFGGKLIVYSDMSFTGFGDIIMDIDAAIS